MRTCEAPPRPRSRQRRVSRVSDSNTHSEGVGITSLRGLPGYMKSVTRTELN